MLYYNDLEHPPGSIDYQFYITSSWACKQNFSSNKPTQRHVHSCAIVGVLYSIDDDDKTPSWAWSASLVQLRLDIRSGWWLPLTTLPKNCDFTRYFCFWVTVFSFDVTILKRPLLYQNVGDAEAQWMIWWWWHQHIKIFQDSRITELKVDSISIQKSSITDWRCSSQMDWIWK